MVSDERLIIVIIIRRRVRIPLAMVLPSRECFQHKPSSSLHVECFEEDEAASNAGMMLATLSCQACAKLRDVCKLQIVTSAGNSLVMCV